MVEVISENQNIKDIANFLNIKLFLYDLKRIKKENINAFEISKNLIYFYPLNDGMARWGYKFYQNDKLIIGNDKEFSQLSNLDDIILQMVRIYNLALDNQIVLDPYYFMLELTDEICKDYHGNATLVITEKAIMNHKLNKENFDAARKKYINRFLDHFIGWNFGVSVNRSEELKNELEELNEKVIDMGIREKAESGFEVYGIENEAYNGLQHYTLPFKRSYDSLEEKGKKMR